MTQPQELPQFALLERVVEVLKANPRLRAAFLRGSFYRGQPDVYSDLDLFAVAHEADAEKLLDLGRTLLRDAGGSLWISALDAAPPRLRALFPGPLRLELTIVTTDTLPPYEGWRILFDHGHLLRTRARAVQTPEPLRPEHVAMICDTFWWNLFSSVGQLKRGQLWMALHLLDACRADLAQILRWRRDPEHPAERYIDLERHLTAEDQQALAQTLAGYDLRAIAVALLTASDAFDPAAREVAARVGGDYPVALAQITKQFFVREFWALIAPGPAISA
ncbi:MAG TPA: aminoglycoside 6-adenylyltransferase [Roseiflexaceae bacterium]|nr:aminoglycoside 6-adenylyltransferase [Roseiflexaceae bacterium]